MEHFRLAAEYCALLALYTYHQSFLLFHVVHILDPVSIAEPAAPRNHSQSQLRNCHLWNASFQVQEPVTLHIKGKGRISPSWCPVRILIYTTETNVVSWDILLPMHLEIAEL